MEIQNVQNMVPIKLLSAAWHYGSANAIAPVLEYMPQKYNVEMTNIAHEVAEQVFSRQGISCNTISDYKLRDVSPESVARIFDKVEPEIVLVGTSAQDQKNRFVLEQAVTQVAKANHIPSVAVVDFWSSYTKRFSDIYDKENGKFKYLPTKIAIMDEFAKQEMWEKGFEPSIIEVTGNPYFDNLEKTALAYTEKDKEQARKAIGSNADTLFFYACTAFHESREARGYWDLDNIKILNDVLMQQSREKNIELIVKLHPSGPEYDAETITNYIRNIDNTKNKNIKLVRRIDSKDLVLASDLTITSFSTVGIEAVYMHRPCISMQPNLKTRDSLRRVTEQGFVPVGYTPKDCQKLVKLLINDRKYREEDLIKKGDAFRTHSNATQKVAQLVHLTWIAHPL